MNKFLKINYLIIFLILALFVYSCNLSNNGNILSDDEYFAQQALENNQNDSLILGISLTMNKEQVLAQLEEEGAWDFYSTAYGQERLKLRGLGDRIPSDDYGVNEAFNAKIVLKSEDERYSEEIVTILLDFYEERLLDVKVCAFGSSNEVSCKHDDELFRTLKATLGEKYGKPYKEKDHSVLWVDGNTHITLSFDCCEKAVSQTFSLSGYRYSPIYLITYSDWTFSKKVEELKKEEYIRKKQEYEEQERKTDSLNQERLSKEYKGL